MKTKILVFIASVLAAGCAAGGGNENDEGVVYFDVDGGSEKSFFDFFERADIIPLETSDSSVVGSLSDVEFIGDTLFGLDMRRSRIVSFMADGTYLGAFSKPGDGPDDHGYVSTFHVNPYNGYLVVLEPFYSRLSVYDRKTEKKVQVIKLKEKWDGTPALHNFYPLSADKYAFFCRFAKENNVLIYDGTTDSLYRQTIEIPDVIVETGYFDAPNPFNKVGGDIYFGISYLNAMFRFDGEYFVPYKKLDFGKYGHIEDYYLPKSHNRKEALDYISENDDKYAVFLSVPMHTPSRLMFAVRHDVGGERRALAVIDRNTGETMFVRGLKEGFSVFPNVSQQGEYVYRVEDVYYMWACINEKVLDPKNRAILERLSDEDNPVLIRYKLKP